MRTIDLSRNDVDTIVDALAYHREGVQNAIDAFPEDKSGTSQLALEILAIDDVLMRIQGCNLGCQLMDCHEGECVLMD